jgi:hypothetical protein
MLEGYCITKRSSTKRAGLLSLWQLHDATTILLVVLRYITIPLTVRWYWLLLLWQWCQMNEYTSDKYGTNYDKWESCMVRVIIVGTSLLSLLLPIRQVYCMNYYTCESSMSAENIVSAAHNYGRTYCVCCKQPSQKCVCKWNKCCRS